MEVVQGARRFNVVDCGRRWGKTLLGTDRAIHTALNGYPVGWFAPTYKHVTEAWRDLTRLLADVLTTRNASEMRMELITGGVIEVWSLTNEDAGRSRKYKRVIIDEAALVPNLMAIWNAAIRPTLLDMAGDAFFLSTPKGRNGFWQMYQRGIDQEQEDWIAWKMPTSANPFIPISEIEAMRHDLPERIFSQEIMADFLEDAGGVFRRVMDAATGTEQAPVAGRQYLFGVDWGKSNDFTVITVVDVAARAVVFVDRFNQIDYALQTQRLKALRERYKPGVIIAEANAMGEPIIEQLWRDGLPVQPFQTTNATKAQIIDGLAVAFERGEITILNDDIMIGELQAYEMQRTKTGLWTYSAPEGMHDDCVMSLALAWSGVQDSGGILL